MYFEYVSIIILSTGSMRGLFEEVEGGLLALEDLDEELSLQEQTLDLRLSLALAREKHTHRLNVLKSEFYIQKIGLSPLSQTEF